MSFAIGYGGQHLHLAYRVNNSNGLSAVHYAECFDAPVGTCYHDTNGANVNWNDTTNWPPPPGYSSATSQFQPAVAADKFSENVAFTWYQFLYASGPRSLYIAPVGVFSVDGGANWSSTLQLVGSSGIAPACPTPQLQKENLNYWGDYVGSAILPFTLTPPEITLITSPWIVTAHADSRGGCAPASMDGGITYDQHVQAAVW